jgi:23S rRNA (uracil747-C5)-methyltransferase
MNTFCSYFNQAICKSCNRLEDSYEIQIQVKLDKLAKLLNHSTYEVLPPVLSKTTEFRNKAKFSITGLTEDPIIGLTGESDLDLGREITACLLHHPEINKLAQALPAFIKLANLEPYQIKNKKGELKGAIVYYSSDSQQMYLRLILRSKESLDRINKHSKVLLSQFPKIQCFSANIQPIAHAILEGEEEIFFSENTFIKHQVSDVKMTLHPQGFVQTNHLVAEKLYSTAASWVKDLKVESFLELFSGQGAFSFFIQKHVTKALGVEINPEAVMRATQTAQEMKWDHLKFIASDAASVEETAMAFNPDLILVNPPRRGLGKSLELLRKSKAQYFIYSSCNAISLADDLNQLKEHFEIVKVQLFDMFPHTDHFETLVLLKSLNAGKT